MTDQEDKTDLGKIVSGNSPAKNSWAGLGKIFQISDCAFFPTFCNFF